MTRNAADARIAARHDDIPQEPLFDIDAATDHSEKQRTRYVKSVDHGKCPTCGQDEVGQVRGAGVELVWRDHYRMAGRVRLRCSGSATAVGA